MSKQIFFSKINATKRQELIDYLANNQCEFFVKFRDNHYRSKFIRNTGLGSVTIFNFLSETLTTLEKKEQVTCSFDVKDEKFFFKSVLSARQSEFELSMPIEIMQLQRRNDFRVSIPPRSGYLCEIVKVNREKKKVPVDLRNLSLGGCQIALDLKELELKTNDQFNLRMLIKDFEAESIPAVAKHIVPNAVDGSNMVLVGVKFIDPQADFLTELQSALMYLDRVQRQRRQE